MQPDFVILTDSSEILAFSKDFSAKIFKSPNFSQLILLVSPLDYLMSIVVTFSSGGGRQKKSIRIFILQLKISWPIATVAMKQKLSD